MAGKTRKELLKQLNSPEAQKKLLEVLKDYDLLRERSKVQTILESVILGDIKKTKISYNLYNVTNLPLKETTKLSGALKKTVLVDIIPQLEALPEVPLVAASKAPLDNNQEIQIVKKEPQVSIRAKRKIINLKDIFEADGDESDPATEEEVPKEIQEWKDEIAQIRTQEKEHETKVISSILESVAIEISPEQKKKMSDIVSSRIKNIRDAVDTRLALSRAVEEGGLGLSDKEASEVSLLIEKNLKELTSAAKTEKGTIRTALGEIATPSKPAKANVPIPIEKIVVDAASKEEVPIIPISKKKKVKIAPEPEKIIEEPSPPPGPFIDPLPEEQEPEMPKEPPVAHIAEKKKAGLIGPIEELEEATIEDWRSLYKTPQLAVEEVKEKLRVLKKNSFKQMVKGVTSWKKGKIMNLYIEVGAESAKNSVSIKESADMRKGQNRSYLTEDEFHAIMDLNRELRTYAL